MSICPFIAFVTTRIASCRPPSVFLCAFEAEHEINQPIAAIIMNCFHSISTQDMDSTRIYTFTECVTFRFRRAVRQEVPVGVVGRLRGGLQDQPVHCERDYDFPARRHYL